MSLVAAIVIFAVGLISGVVGWGAGLAALVALLLVAFGAAPAIGIVGYVVEQYYHGDELLFLAGFLFGIDAGKTKEWWWSAGRSGSERRPLSSPGFLAYFVRRGNYSPRATRESPAGE